MCNKAPHGALSDLKTQLLIFLTEPILVISTKEWKTYFCLNYLDFPTNMYWITVLYFNVQTYFYCFIENNVFIKYIQTIFPPSSPPRSSPPTYPTNSMFPLSL